MINLELIGDEILYDKYLDIGHIDDKGIQLLFEGLEDELKEVCEKLYDPKYQFFGFSINLDKDTSKGLYGDLFLTMEGAMNASTERLKKKSIHEFSQTYGNFFAFLKNNFMRNSQNMGLSVTIKTYRDFIIEELEDLNY